jgi:GT2 family glycosyltransferase
MAKIGVIIVNFKDYANKFLADCRDGLENQTLRREDYAVYIVDNASSEESLRYLKQNYSEAIILPRKDGNFSAANNLGTNRAIKDGCQIVVIVNMDVEIDQNWLKSLTDPIYQNKNAIYQSKLLSYFNKNKINSIGNSFHYLGFGFTDGNNTEDKYGETAIKELQGFASGCALAFHRDVWVKVNGWNEDYYMYHDDLEFGWKARLLGIKSYLVTNSIIYHKYQFNRSMKMVYYMERNRYLAMLHFYKWKTLVVLFPMIAILEIAMWFYSIISGWWIQKLKVLIYFFRISTWKKILSTRKQVQITRKVRDQEIIATFKGKVIFQEINNPVLQHIGNPLMNIYFKLAKRIIFW